MPYVDINRKCKLCKEIDDKYPYYDFNTEECISKCTKVTYNNICYDNCNQIDSKHKYEKNENNECIMINSENSTKLANSDNSKNSGMYINKINLLFLISLLLLF